MNDKQIDKYLFSEMPESEREKFEDRFVSDDDLFYEIAERENELVDLYARGELKGEELKRFEKSLESFPARKQKIENAKILREFIADERPENKTITIAERAGFFSRLFSFGPALQFASVAALVLLAVTSIFLFTENRRLGSLQQELAASRQRESELAARIEDESATSGDLTAELAAERERAEQLQADIEKLRISGEGPPSVKPPTTIATLVLSSAVIPRGGSVPVRRLQLTDGVDRVSLVIGVPTEAPGGLSLTLNGETVARSLTPRLRRGEKSVAVTIPATKLKAGRNEITVRESDDTVAASYIIVVERTP